MRVYDILIDIHTNNKKYHDEVPKLILKLIAEFGSTKYQRCCCCRSNYFSPNKSKLFPNIECYLDFMENGSSAAIMYDDDDDENNKKIKYYLNNDYWTWKENNCPINHLDSSFFNYSLYKFL